MTLLQVQGLAKRYGAVQALTGVGLAVEPGEIHAVLGANGAGKSTLVKILSGVERPTAGTVLLRGRQVRLSSPGAARAAGLAPVFQDPALIPDLSVAENLALTGTDKGAFGNWMDWLCVSADQGSLVSALPLPVIRILDLARALAHEPELLLLDEITAALPADLAERVFAVMQLWRERGRSVLFVSHRLGEVVQHCGRATVLRDGRDVGQLVASAGSEQEILDLMLGPATPGGEPAGRLTVPRPAGAAEPGQSRQARAAAESRAAPESRAALEARGIAVHAEGAGGVSFALGWGEVLGVAALDGQGQDELFAYLSGEKKPWRGEIVVEGQPVALRSPYDAIRRGIVLVPSDRSAALLPQRSVRENLVFPRFAPLRRWGIISRRDEQSRVTAAVTELDIDVRAQQQARRLSGGNQQKVAVGRWLAAGFRILLCFDPTRGIDLHTKSEIHRLLRDLANGGAAVLLYTSELAEIPVACDRVIVLHRGAVTDELPAGDAGEAALLRAAHGLARQEVK